MTGSAPPSILASLSPFFRSRSRAILQIAAISMVVGLIGLVGPLSLRSITDTIREWNAVGPAPMAIWGWIFFLFCGRLLSGLGESFQAGRQIKLGFEVISDLQLAVFRRLHRAPMQFFASTRQGDILYRLTNDIEVIKDLNSDALPRLTQEIVAATVALVAMWVLHPLTAGIILLASLLFMMPGLLLTGRLRRMTKRDNAFLEKIYAHLQESVETPRLVRTFGLQDREVAFQRTELDSWNRVSLDTALLRKVARQMPRFGIILMPGLVFLTAGLAMWNGSLTLGDLVALVGLTPSIFAPFHNLADNFGLYQQAVPSLERVCAFLHLEEEQPGGLPAFPTLRGDIQFRDVRFGYGSTGEVLRGLDLHIRPGEHVAIVGASGSGKSTIVNLLMGLYQPDSGSLLVDGLEPRSRDLQSLRQQVGFVAQDTFLLNGSLKDNLLYAAPEASDADLDHALRVADLKSLVDSLPAGLETIVGERGLRLSGGQRQRLAVARAVLRDPRLLIFDEATSSLDGETEAQLQSELEALMPGRTAITIAHRFATVRNCDRIVVLVQGRIVEEGSFDELLRQCGAFTELYNAQFHQKSGWTVDAAD